MDLRIAGRKAIVCASSQGLGYACARSLSREGALVFINGRHAEKLEAAARVLQAETGSNVVPVCADINTAAGREHLILACPEADILVTNNAGPMPGSFDDWTEEIWQGALQANLLAPIFMIKALVRGMQARRFGRIVNITSAMVKSPRLHQGLSTTARTGLTAFCKALSIDVARDNVTLNNLLPERINTGRMTQMTQRMMALDGISHDEAVARIVSTIAAGRPGTAEEFGDACAFLCSDQSGYISGQNLQLDGGSYPGTL